jgi:hypothetical protein
MELTKHRVFATLTKKYEIDVEAVDIISAMNQLDEWIADDFEPFEVDAQWILEAN